jgi:hypothetical protein
MQRPKGFRGFQTGMPIEPSGKHNAGVERGGFARKVRKDDLRNVSGKMNVPFPLAQRDGINQAEMDFNQACKRILRLFFHILPEQFSHITDHILQSRCRRGRKPDKKFDLL